MNQQEKLGIGYAKLAMKALGWHEVLIHEWEVKLLEVKQTKSKEEALTAADEY